MILLKVGRKVRFLFMIGAFLWQNPVNRSRAARSRSSKRSSAPLFARLISSFTLSPDWFLRVLIDRDEPLDTDTCEAVSRAIDPLLDEADPIEQSYYLEVGSPGLGRRLTRPEHYEQLKGQKCAAHLIRPDEQGRRDYAGILQGLDADGNVTLTDGEETYAFPVKSAGYVKLCDDEDLFG